MPNNKPFDIQHYLKATSDSSKRTRTVSFTLVIVSVLVFAGLLNSFQASWMLQRIKRLNAASSDLQGYLSDRLTYLNSLDEEQRQKALELLPEKEKEAVLTYDSLVNRIGPPLSPLKDNAIIGRPTQQDIYAKRYDDWYQAFVRSYAENTYNIRVPLFGFSFDVNDLGLLGGIAFLVLLLLFRFCLSREIDNLKLSFAEAFKLERIYEFYTLLAMRQVLTVPRTPFIRRTRFLLGTPKMICLLPAAIHLWVLLHDYSTFDIGSRTNQKHAVTILSSEIILWLFISAVTFMVIKRLVMVDSIWDQWWPIISEKAEERAKAAQDMLVPVNESRNKISFKKLFSVVLSYPVNADDKQK